MVAIAAICGGAVLFGQMRLRMKRIQREQVFLCEIIAREGSSAGNTAAKGGGEEKRKPKIGVDKLFAKRLREILSVCVPSFLSKETLYIAIQSGLLISRTLLTDRIAALEGGAGQSVVSKDWPMFTDMMWNFAATAVPASFVNSGLKYMQVLISLAFRQRLTEYLHQRYLSNRVYYVASTLGGLSNADQRIAEDVDRFASAVSELFSYTFKPVLDIILFTRSLSQSIGYKGQLFLYVYFIFCSGFLRRISPPLALMTAQESALSGNFRNAHQRLVAHAEEVAFNDPPAGDTERLILNDHLYRLLRHSRLSAYQRFIQQVADGYLVKYAASVVGLCVYAAPIYFSKQQTSSKSLTGDYIRAMRLMMNTSSAIGQLVLVYKRVTSLAGVTSRVSELLESVRQLSTKEGQKKANIMKTSLMNETCQGENSEEELLPPLPPKYEYADLIRFERVTVSSPDGTVLVRDLSFEVREGESVILMGPNGSGKSSLFRVLAELWPLQCGIIWRPPRGDIFYLSQRPYVVRGSLRDQVRYPAVPRSIARAVSRHYGHRPVRGQQDGDEEEDERVVAALEATEIGYLIQRGEGLNQQQNWEETLSGGERQRLAIARVLFHRPMFAVLDECTSAVSADGEDHLYQELQKAGITLLSIAHRPALKKYHKFVLSFDGSLAGFGWSHKSLKEE